MKRHITHASHYKKELELTKLSQYQTRSGIEYHTQMRFQML